MSRERLMYILLGVFLILTGLVAFISGFTALGLFIAILALTVGVMIFIAHPDISIFIGWILVAAYLLLLGLSGIANLSFSGMAMIMNILAIAAGIVLLIGSPGFRHHIGFLLFCFWLIFVGFAGLFGFGNVDFIISIIAITSGVLLIVNV
jgi:hypothetical protein